MKKTFKVIQIKNASDPFPLDDKQIQHEYSVFPSMVANLFINPRIKANGERSVNCAVLTLEGNVSDAELDLAAEQIRVTINTKKVEGRFGQPNFVFTK